MLTKTAVADPVGAGLRTGYEKLDELKTRPKVERKELVSIATQLYSLYIKHAERDRGYEWADERLNFVWTMMDYRKAAKLARNLT
jgi:hypothetical protein